MENCAAISNIKHGFYKVNKKIDWGYKPKKIGRPEAAALVLTYIRRDRYSLPVSAANGENARLPRSDPRLCFAEP